MSRLPRIGKYSWQLGCLACRCLNLALFCLALGLGALLLLNLLQREIPLPDKLARFLINKAGPAHLEADWATVVFDLRFGLLLSDFRVTDRQSGQLLATAERMRLDLSPLTFLIPLLSPLQEIDAQDIDLYLPASLSPSGLNEPVIRVRNLSARENKGQLELASLLLKTGEIEIFAHGSAPLALFKGGDGGPQPNRLYPLLLKLRRLPQEVPAFADIRWTGKANQGHSFHVNALLPHWRSPEAALSRLRASALLHWGKRGLALEKLQLNGRLEEIGYETGLAFLDQMTFDPFPFELQADGPLQATPFLSLPTRVQLNLHPRSDHPPLRHLLLRSTLWTSNPQAHWIASGERLFAAGMATGLPAFLSEGSAPSRPVLDFRAYLPNPQLSQYLPGPPKDRLLENAHAAFLRLNARFHTPSNRLSGTVLGDGLFLGQTPFAHLSARFSLSPERLDLPHIHVQKTHNESASGSYFHHFPSTRFSLNARGATFPSSLDVLLGHWWTAIFTNIHAPHPLPADVTVWGHWRELTSLQSVTWVNGEGAFYRGLEVPHLDLRVRSNWNWAYLERLEARFTEGRIGGTLAMRIGLEEETRFRALVLDFESDASWEAVRQASGLEELSVLQFEANPQVTARGILWLDSGKGFTAKPRGDLFFHLTQQGGLSRVEGLELRGLAVDGYMGEKTLRLEDLSGQFAEGVFAGDIFIEDWQDAEKRVRRFDLELFDADYGKAVSQLTTILEDPEAVRESLGKENGQGRLNASVNLRTGKSLDSPEGKGSVWLREAEIGQIHLLGGLSRFLQSQGLGFSSLNLDSAAVDWTLSENRLEIEKALITGPVISLSVEGEVGLQEKRLDMVADVTLFSGLVSKVLSPVSENLRFDLEGTLASPQWQVRLTPFRWFQNRFEALGDGSGE